MKKLLLLSFVLIFICATSTYAQSYKTAVGLTIEVGDGSTLVGPSIKHFLKDQNALSGELLFGTHVIFLQAFYHYQQGFSGTKNLNWYLGGGPSVGFYSFAGVSKTNFYLRPMAGLEYKLDDVPLAFSFDWRPFLYLGTGGGDRFTAARFGIGFKYVLN